MRSNVRSFSFISITVLGLAACSSDPATPDAATDVPVAVDNPPVTDAGVDVATDTQATDVPRDVAMADASDASSSDVIDAATDAATDGGAGCTLTRALVNTSAFGAGGGYAIGTITPPALTASMTAAADQDHVAVQSGCIVFDMFRTSDELHVLDTTRLPAIARTIPLRAALMTDAGPMAMNVVNPYDVLALSPTRAFVVQFALSRVAIVNPSLSGAAAITGSIDLAPVRASADVDPSGAPEAAAIVAVGARAYVLMQNLSSFAPVANGTLAVIDAAAGTLVDADATAAGTQPITLSGRNPNTVVAQGANRLVVSLTGAFGATDGGIETVDLSTNRPSGILVTEASLGGDVSSFVMLSDTRGWALVSRSGGDAGPTDARVVEFDLGTRTVTRTVLTVAGAFDLGGIAKAPDGNVWVSERTTGHAGVRVFRADATEITTAPLATGTLPPSGIVFVP